MRLGLFGGTFDPIHSGHLLLAEAARESQKLERVMFIPAALPPHKKPPVASAAQRLNMLRLAIASNPHFGVDDWEIRQKRVVYSYETVAHYRRLRPDDELFFIVGGDMLKTILMWKNGPGLLKQCRFLAAERPGVPNLRLPPAVKRRSKVFPWPAVPLASHEIRQRVKTRRSIRYQVPDAVERYIRTHHLYA
jgi:nicotinate-nucleotide adenylyltransferase